MLNHDGAIVTFYRMIAAAQLPERADRSALGTLPTRAFRYCDPVTTAAGFGWYVSIPIDLYFIWDGNQIFWRCEGLEDWLPLTSAQYPYFSKHFADAAPVEFAQYAPPFLTALKEPGLVQIWTGLAARTAPRWSLLIRPLSNLPRISGLEAYEGIVETDHSLGLLFTNFRITVTGTPIFLRAGDPLLQLQPIPQIAYSSKVLDNINVIDSLESFTSDDWTSYEAAFIAPLRDNRDLPGRYAVDARKRRASACRLTANQVDEGKTET